MATDPIPTPDQLNDLHRRIDELIELSESLPVGARTDMDEKVRQVEVMRGALNRDLHEAALNDGGADEETVNRLFSELERQSRELARELETLAQGAPTTLDAAADAGIRLVAKVVSRETDASQEKA